MAAEATSQSFRLERRGDIAIITPSPEVESMHEHLIEQAAQLVLAPLKADPPAGLVVDLSQVLAGPTATKAEIEAALRQRLPWLSPAAREAIVRLYSYGYK